MAKKNTEKLAPKCRKNRIWGHFSSFSPFLGHFFRNSRGPFSIFGKMFSYFSAFGPFSNLAASRGKIAL